MTLMTAAIARRVKAEHTGYTRGISFRNHRFQKQKNLTNKTCVKNFSAVNPSFWRKSERPYFPKAFTPEIWAISHFLLIFRFRPIWTIGSSSKYTRSSENFLRTSKTHFLQKNPAPRTSKGSKRAV